MSATFRTRVGNSLALMQVLSADGLRVASFVRAGDGNFRFIEETHTYEPRTKDVNDNWYWKQTLESGLYETAGFAWESACCEISWLRDAPTASGS